MSKMDIMNQMQTLGYNIRHNHESIARLKALHPETMQSVKDRAANTILNLTDSRDRDIESLLTLVSQYVGEGNG